MALIDLGRINEALKLSQRCIAEGESGGLVYYGKSFYQLVIERYADNRFLTIELLLNNKKGLKIPNSAITTKEFFVIPKNYFMKGNDSNKQGLMVKKSGGNEFINPTIYYETDDAYYIDNELIDSKDYILKPNSNEEYRVDTKTDELQGVYNVNKGYAVFKQIVILNQNKEYAIVDKNTNYGISLYSL